MDYETAIGILFFSWGAGWVSGYQLRQIADAINAI
jgi:hypothetical protein